jgi:hypothetical protein
VSLEQATIASAKALIRVILRIQPPEMVPSDCHLDGDTDRALRIRK